MSNQPKSEVFYAERVLPGIASFLPTLLVFPTFWLAFAPINTPIGATAGVLATALVVGLIIYASPTITVTKETIRVGKARINLSLTGKLEIISEHESFAEKGPKLDSRAFLALQSSVKGLIKLEITDQNDPTPYWLFSSKSPENLISAISKAKN